ncbi:MAG: hypothetical protein IT233_04510 [Bacteroidia bacterium]|nr:hypothetical protein [Bacteroidia bacterium]
MKRLVLFFPLLILIASCAKDPGSGGNSSITGKVKVRQFNGSFTLLTGVYYGPDEEVYLIYGDDSTSAYDERTRTAPGGNYEFSYLRPGKYWVYAYAEDSTLASTKPIAIFKQVEITDKKQEVTADDIIIQK